MAGRYPEAEKQPPRVMTQSEMDIAFEELRTQVEYAKQQLRESIQQIHEMVSQREVELMEELDEILIKTSNKIEERRVSLDQLTKNREETEQLQANRLSSFVKNQLTNIQEEMDKIISEEIQFPYVTLELSKHRVQEQIKCIGKINKAKSNKYGSEVIWAGGNRGKGKNELNVPTAICIDPSSSLIYVTELADTHRIQIFSSEGKYHSSLVNKDINESSTIRIHGEYIYVNSCTNNENYVIKLDKKGNTFRSILTTELVGRLALYKSSVYCCYLKSRNLDLFDLNLNFEKRKRLKVKSHTYNTFTRDVIVEREQIFVLFSSDKDYHLHPIQIFKLDGALLRSVVSGGEIKEASYFCRDRFDNFIVTDRTAHCIKVISQDGGQIQTIGKEGKCAPGELQWPKGIAVDGCGRIIVVDWKESNRLQAF